MPSARPPSDGGDIAPRCRWPAYRSERVADTVQYVEGNHFARETIAVVAAAIVKLADRHDRMPGVG